MNKFKTIIVSLVCFVFMIGCANISIKNEDAKNLLIKTSARVLAYKVLINNSKYIEPVKLYCEAMQKGDINQSVLDTGVDFLSNMVGDDYILRASFFDLKELIVIDVSSPEFNSDIIKMIATAFYEGAELAKLQLGE